MLLVDQHIVVKGFVTGIQDLDRKPYALWLVTALIGVVAYELEAVGIQQFDGINLNQID